MSSSSAREMGLASARCTSLSRRSRDEAPASDPAICIISAAGRSRETTDSSAGAGSIAVAARGGAVFWPGVPTTSLVSPTRIASPDLRAMGSDSRCSFSSVPFLDPRSSTSQAPPWRKTLAWRRETL